MWACRFPRAKLVVGENGLVFQIKCMICSKIKGKLKMLVPNHNMLQKHVGHWKALIVNPNLAIGDFYYSHDVTYRKNEWFFIGWNSKSIMTLV
jgi:hypothetical protein